MTIVPRKGPVQLAGTRCKHKNHDGRVCNEWARYCVSAPSVDKLVVLYGTCGRHVSDYIRQVWDEHSTAGIVQEIPGAWRK